MTIEGCILSRKDSNLAKECGAKASKPKSGPTRETAKTWKLLAIRNSQKAWPAIPAEPITHTDCIIKK